MKSRICSALIFLALILLTLASTLTTTASASPVFESAYLLPNQPYLSIVPTLKDKSLVCDRTSIYWAVISDLRIRGSGTYRMIRNDTGVFQVTARDNSGNEIPVYDGATLLKFSQQGPADYVRGLNFEIRLEDICLANKNKQFTPDEFLEYVQKLQISAVPAQPIR